MHLFSTGEKTAARAGIEAAKIKKVIEEGGELARYELLRCRVRYFSDGVALGSRLFVEEVFENHRSLFGERRKTGARRLRGGDWAGLYSLRNLSKAIAAPG